MCHHPDNKSDTIKNKRRGSTDFVPFLNLKTNPYAIKKGSSNAYRETGPLLINEHPKNSAASSIRWYFFRSTEKQIELINSRHHKSMGKNIPLPISARENNKKRGGKN